MREGSPRLLARQGIYIAMGHSRAMLQVNVEFFNEVEPVGLLPYELFSRP